MASRNNQNVFKGPSAVRDYFDPDNAPPLPLVELPEALNPYRDDGVHIYAKMMSAHPANNVKAMPAMNLLQHRIDPAKTKTIVEYSSGSTVISMALVSRALYGIGDVHAFLSNKTTAAKINLMRFFGLNITLFGGPSQPEPGDERGGIHAAYRWAADKDSVTNPDQYGNDLNWKSHVRWTGPQILEQLPEINVVCAGMGTSGTMSGLGTYFKDAKPSVFRLGVCTKAGDRVPGPRSLALLAPVTFPWKESVDHIEEVGSQESFLLSLQLCRNGLISGPSSGFNLQGVYQFIEQRKSAGTLGDLAGDDGQIHCVFLCCDLPYQYIDEYYDKLDVGHFPPIRNSELSTVDLYRYDEAWEKDPHSVLDDVYGVGGTLARDMLLFLCKRRSGEREGWEKFVSPAPDTVVIDLRQRDDYDEFSLPGSISMPVVVPDRSEPFVDASVLASLWRELETRFGPGGGDKDNSLQPDMCSQLKDKNALLLCYNGNSARVATSVLRAKGIRADSMRGGIKALHGLSALRGC